MNIGRVKSLLFLSYNNIIWSTIMNKASQIILGSLITLSSLFGSVPEARANTHEEHKELWVALQQVGIDTMVNHPDLCDNGVVDGAYINLKSILIVCQDNAHRFGSKEVNWTENDYDTLRHEAHHVIQDCLDGGLADGNSDLLFNNPEDLEEFVFDILTEEQVNHIIDVYKKQGATDDVILQELEAFAVANGVSPSSIAGGVLEACGAQ